MCIKSKELTSKEVTQEHFFGLLKSGFFSVGVVLSEKFLHSYDSITVESFPGASVGRLHLTTQETQV